MIKLIEDLWYKPRNLVSDAYDEALDYISKIIPLKIHKVATGTKCWTWHVPEKWSVKEAWIEDMKGNRILDLKDHPLHVLSYSLPVDKTVSKEVLLEHLHTIPNKPNTIPYEFKFYERDWGFCIEHNKLEQLTDDNYKIFIDSKFENGTLKIGECIIPGQSDNSIVLVAHSCHPAMANDDLAGVSVLVDIAKDLSQRNNFYTYRCLFLPETIGSIAFLSQNEDLIPQMKYGIFLEMLGNDNKLSLQLSLTGDTSIDHISRYVMNNEINDLTVGKFRTIINNDEMIFNGPGVGIPMISISRWPYPEYHSSDDNMNIISEEKLYESTRIILKILKILDMDYIPKRKFKGPVFLSGYGLWVDWRENKKLNQNLEQIMLRLEGNKTIFEISQELDMDFFVVYDFLEKFYDNDLLSKNPVL